jgi:hypothetical protein
MKHAQTCGFVLSLLLASAAWPQAGTSTVRGLVRDQVQAVIPGARVSLTNTATGVARETLTNTSGLYTFPTVTSGAYRLTIESPGMQKWEGNLQVQTAQDASVDVALTLATNATTVEVQDVTPALQTDSPSLGHVLERQRIESLPGIGRGYQNLLQTVPGVTWSSHGHGVGGRMQAYGMQNGANMIMLDGAPINETYEGWDMPRTPDLDTLQEIKVEVNNSSAKYSRPTGVIMSTRSGTNQFHGSVFHNQRNSFFGSRRRQDVFAKAPLDNRNEFGFTAGGPVYIPKLYDGRNRTFFFWSYEGTRYARYTTNQSSVPTEAMKRGDFRGLVDSQGRTINIYDPATTSATAPYTRQIISHNGIPNTINPARMSPVAKFMFDNWLPANVPGVNPLIEPNRIVPVLRSLYQETYNTRIDHRISPTDQFFFRYSRNVHKEQYSSGSAYFQPIGGVNVVDHVLRWWPNHNAAVSWLKTISPTFTNEINVTGFRDWHQRGAGLDPTRFGGEPRSQSFADILKIPNPFNAQNWPVFGGLGLGTAGGEAPYYLVSSFFTVEDNATKVVGKHEIQFGLQFRYEMTARNNPLTANLNFGNGSTGLYDPQSLTNAPQQLPQTGFGLANLFLGAGTYSAGFGRPWIYMRKNELAPYFQDTWRVSQRLTLNLGLRWDLRTPNFDHDGQLMSFDLDKRAYVLQSSEAEFIARGNTLPSIVAGLKNFGGKIITNDEAGLPERMSGFNWKNIGPRFGFAYKALDGRKAFVVRGGYRISSYPTTSTSWLGSQFDTQLTNGNFSYDPNNATLSPDGIGSYMLRTPQQYVAGVNTPSSLININETRLLTRGSFNGIRISPDLRDPMVHDYNVTLEKEIFQDTVIRFGFVGNTTRYIQQNQNLNNTTPTFIWNYTRGAIAPPGAFANVATRPYDQTVYGNITQYNSTGKTWYNGGQFEIEKRFNRGIGFQLFYNLANTIAQTGNVVDPRNYIPGTIPTDYDEVNRFMNKQRSTTAPQHQVRWNFIADLPFGKGKALAGNAGGVLNTIIGGWQIAGTGNWLTSFWTLPTNGLSFDNPVKVYGYDVPIEDCTSGVCYPGYLWWNGYIPANRRNSRDAQGRPNGIMGLPADYKPAYSFFINQGQTTLPANAPANTNLTQFYDTNNVWLRLNDGSVQRIVYDNGVHPWRNQYMRGVNQWFQNAALFKFFKLTERVTMRFNWDVFNVFNNPNNPAGNSIGANGVLATRNSGSEARTMQFALRLTW